MPDTNTKWAGLIIRTKATDSKLFVGLVTDALDKINSKPVGKALLDTIAAEVGKAKFGYTVCIMPKASIKNSFGPLIRWRTYEKGSVTVTGNEEAASNGTGAISSIKWDPKNEETPDGSRPPFIALAHELIHCMHNLLGTSHIIGGDDAKKLDEMRVTGLKGYEQEPISENRIRKEHGIAYRNSYSGKCSKEEGTPDKAAFV
jgi:hypothetical protein